MAKSTNYTPTQPTKNGSLQHMMKGHLMKTGRPSMRKLPGAR